MSHPPDPVAEPHGPANLSQFLPLTAGEGGSHDWHEQMAKVQLMLGEAEGRFVVRVPALVQLARGCNDNNARNAMSSMNLGRLTFPARWKTWGKKYIAPSPVDTCTVADAREVLAAAQHAKMDTLKDCVASDAVLDAIVAALVDQGKAICASKEEQFRTSIGLLQGSLGAAVPDEAAVPDDAAALPAAEAAHRCAQQPVAALQSQLQDLERSAEQLRLQVHALEKEAEHHRLQVSRPGSHVRMSFYLDVCCCCRALRALRLMYECCFIWMCGTVAVHCAKVSVLVCWCTELHVGRQLAGRDRDLRAEAQQAMASAADALRLEQEARELRTLNWPASRLVLVRSVWFRLSSPNIWTRPLRCTWRIPRRLGALCPLHLCCVCRSRARAAQRRRTSAGGVCCRRRTRRRTA